MILIVCVDNSMGMSFNQRRQSTDRILRDRILKYSSQSRLWMSLYSAGQFSGLHCPHIQADDVFLQKAAPGEYCFAENIDVLPFEAKTEELILYRWNRSYPADLFFNIPLAGHQWRLIQSEKFSGYSHKIITEEIYRR